MKFSKKSCNRLSKMVNSLLVFDGLVHAASNNKDYKKSIQYMRYYNDVADELIELGIDVIKFGNTY